MTELEPMRTRIGAPRIFVFQCLTTFDRSSPVWPPGLVPEVLNREESTLIVRFRHRVLGRLVSSVDRVRLFPPDRITLEHLDGVLSTLRETLTLTTDGEATVLEHRGDVALAIPLAGILLERAVAVRMLRREAGRSLERYRVTIEAAARASGRVDSAAR